MTAKESKAVAWMSDSGTVYKNPSVVPELIAAGLGVIPLVPESLLHAAEAELGELRRSLDGIAAAMEVAGEDAWATELRQLLASDGGADGDNEGEGK